MGLCSLERIFILWLLMKLEKLSQEPQDGRGWDLSIYYNQYEKESKKKMRYAEY